MLALLFALAALAPGDVVVGVSTNDGVVTDVKVGDRVVASIAHAPGEPPQGVLVGNAVIATVPTGRGSARVERVPLDGGAPVVLAARATPRQPPIALADDAAAFVRGAGGEGPFDVVVARPGGEEVVAALDVAWATPVRGARAPLFLTIAGDGRGAIVDVDPASGTARVARDLGFGPFRFPCGAGALSDLILVERAGSADGGGHHVVDATTGKSLAASKHPGLSPACGEGVAAWSTGRKDGTVVVRRGVDEKVVRVGRAGVARPQAVALVGGAPVVVVRLDRGAALPQETWVVDARGARKLAEGGAVVVYGIAR